MNTNTIGSPASGKSRRRLSGAVGGPGAVPKPKSSVCSVHIEGDDGGLEMRLACEYLPKVMGARGKYKAADAGVDETTERLQRPVAWGFDDGVIWFSGQEKHGITWANYYSDIMLLHAAVSHPQTQAAARHRLQVLEEKFNLYKLSSVDVEESMDRHRRGGGTFANSTKVDNGTHLVTSMNALELLQFIQTTHETNGNAVVRLVGDKKEPQTLRRMFEVLDVQDPSQLSVEGLGLQSSSEKNRAQLAFLNPDYNRASRSSAEILRVFLTRHELNGGLFLADAVRPNLERNERRTRYLQCTESIIDVAAYQPDDWDKTAKWFAQHGLAGYGTNTYMVQVLHETDGQSGVKYDFEFHQAQFDNFFTPLVHATLAPEDPKNADLASLLKNVGGFVLITDEESREADFSLNSRPPNEMPWKDHVCEMYFAYYFWANLASLNSMRRRLGLNTFQLRSFVPEGSSHVDIPIYSYLLCDAIHHGLMLDEQPVLQYLYTLQQVGVCMSPIGNNAHAVPYMANPFPTFFKRGMKVSLCTDHPLIYHHSTEPLIEEYGTAAKLFRLSGVDMCEIARNSVLISTFSEQQKAAWLGDRFAEGPAGNEADLSNIPTARLEMRAEMLRAERSVIDNANAIYLHSRATSMRNLLAARNDGTAAHSQQLAVPQSADEGLASSMTLQQQVTIQQNPLSLLSDPSSSFPRVLLVGPTDRDSTHTSVAVQLAQAMSFRASYIREAEDETAAMADKAEGLHSKRGKGKGKGIEHAFQATDSNSSGLPFNESEWRFKTVDGIVVAHEVHKIPRIPSEMPLYEEFRGHVRRLREISEHVPIKAFARRRLQLLEHKFKLHLAVNHAVEAGATESKMSSNRDFYQTTKVDTNVRMETGMTARQLLNFIVAKANNNGDDIVNTSAARNGEPQTLRQLLKELLIDPNHLTVDDLNVQVDTALGVASQQYTPQGRDDLLKLVLKTDNAMRGRYFAELTKMTFDNFKRDNFTFAENRLPIYGEKEAEWDTLGNWFDTHGMAGQNNQWMVQIPRIYGHLRKTGKVTNFAQYLENIFNPLWQVSLRPRENPRLFHFVDHITGFDCVEDERRPDVTLGSDVFTAPQNWTSEEDPPYNYYVYHIWANIYSLNAFRKMRDFSTFTFRPSCGEDGHLDHMLGGFLTADAISYGVRLKDNEVLQYLFYLAQIGIAVSPLSNNTKVLDYLDNPFPQMFRRGLNVSLSTDAPLQFHHTQEPLIEEYSIASKVWKLSPTDMCEIARNSVLQSGFDSDFKSERLGQLYFLSSSRSNDPSKTHLSNVRVAYRWETYHNEVSFLDRLSGSSFQRAMLTLEQEASLLSNSKAVQAQDQRLIGGIINVSGDAVDLEKLNERLALMEKDIADYKKALGNLQTANRNLKERLQDEAARDHQAQQLRRQREAERGLDRRLSEPDDDAGSSYSDLEGHELAEGDIGGAPLALEGHRGSQGPFMFSSASQRGMRSDGTRASIAGDQRRSSRTALDAPEHFWNGSSAGNTMPSSAFKGAKPPARAQSASDANQLWQESAKALDAITSQLVRNHSAGTAHSTSGATAPLVPSPPPRRGEAPRY